MLLCGTEKEGDEYRLWQSFVAFSNDGKTWTPLQEALPAQEWLWRIRWNRGQAYGVSYREEKPSKEWVATLWKSPTALHFEKVAQWEIDKHPSEVTLQFEEKTMIALVRRRGPAWIGQSAPPYTKWNWTESNSRFDAPELLWGPSQKLLASGRRPKEKTSKEFVTSLAQVQGARIEPLLDLPSGGDNSYPGMVLQDNLLWMSYYSSHEERSAIYLAKIEL